MPRISIVAAAMFLAGSALASPAAAQDQNEKINQLIIYGDDPCPTSAGAEITVCARKDESERYRIPEPLRGSQSPANDAWNNRVVAYETVGQGGTLSCSPVGPGGSTGCLAKLLDRAYAEKGSDAQSRFSDLIAAEREKRLSTIDAEAAETQARVEEAERQYEERQRAQQGGVPGDAAPGDSAATPAAKAPGK